ncbi:MAG: hypothetical protein J7647_21870 [Cyanobacteria bacterium SBLK]|nr:hypothetical protein [Cyanobacteria bacterium SBLK]
MSSLQAGLATETAVNFLDFAKDTLARQCFAVMLANGLTWEEILSTVTGRLRPDEKDSKTARHLQLAAENLNLKAEDFQPVTKISLPEIRKTIEESQ